MFQENSLYAGCISSRKSRAGIRIFPEEHHLYSLGFEESKFCQQADGYHVELFNPNSKYYRRGYLVRMYDKILGHVKMKGDRTFMSWINFMLNSDEALKSIRMYIVTEDFIRRLDERKPLTPRKWGIIDVEDMSFVEGRKINVKGLVNPVSERLFRYRVKQEKYLWKEIKFSLNSKHPFYL